MSKKITTIGGQALLEGIMMVGPQRTVAAFCSEKGEISTEEITSPRLTKKYPILGKPFIRGIFSLIDSFRLGYKALSLSADKITEDTGEEEEPSKLDQWLTDHLGDKLTGVIMGVAGVLGVALAILLFFLLPTVLFNLLEGAVPADISGWRSVFEGFLRIAIFLGYVVLVSRVPDIHRTFQYHGAEHKTIFCYENDLPLTVENVRKQGRFHPRCGTSFLTLMLLLGIIVGFFIPFSNPFLRTFAKLPVHPHHYERGLRGAKGLRPATRAPLCRVITAPGLWVQRITVKEPDDKMIEAAIAAMEAVIPRKRRGPHPVTHRQLYLQAKQALAQAGIDSPGSDAMALLSHFFGLDRPGLAPPRGGDPQPRKSGGLPPGGGGAGRPPAPAVHPGCLGLHGPHPGGGGGRPSAPGRTPPCWSTPWPACCRTPQPPRAWTCAPAPGP